MIIHSAASIELEADIHKTLSANYEGTRKVLELAMSCTALRSVVHISSAFVNSNQPLGATIHERLYALGYGEQELDPMALARVRGGWGSGGGGAGSGSGLHSWSWMSPQLPPRMLCARLHAAGSTQCIACATRLWGPRACPPSSAPHCPPVSLLPPPSSTGPAECRQ